MPFYIDEYYIILVIPAILFSLLCQFMLSSTYKKYSQIGSRRRMTGMMVAQSILKSNGIYDVSVEHVGGKLTDHFDPQAKKIRLSDEVYNGTSIAALGIAAHETGHSIQHNNGYFPIKIRSAILPITNIGSIISMPIIILGLILSFPLLIDIGLILFSFVFIFQLITLPVEFNASSRAMRALNEYNILDKDELNGTKKVLNAAAMTYVAGLAVTLAQLLRLLILTNRRRR